MTRFSMPRRAQHDLTPEEIADAEQLHDAAVQLLTDAVAGQPLPQADPT